MISRLRERRRKEQMSRRRYRSYTLHLRHLACVERSKLRKKEGPGVESEIAYLTDIINFIPPIQHRWNVKLL